MVLKPGLVVGRRATLGAHPRWRRVGLSKFKKRPDGRRNNGAQRDAARCAAGRSRS